MSDARAPASKLPRPASAIMLLEHELSELAWTGQRRIALAALLLVNLVLAITALQHERGYQLLLFAYWVETVVIGVLNVPKLLIGALFGEPIDTLARFRDALSRLATVLLALIFYAAAFSFLAMIIYLAIATLPLALPEVGETTQPSPRGRWGTADAAQWIVGSLVVSHGISFVANFLYGREFRGASLITLAVEPFLRVIWIVLVVVSAVSIAHLQPLAATSTGFTVVLVGFKLVGDVYAHLRERWRFGD